MSRSRRSVEIELSRSALRHNFSIARELCPQSKTFAVLKSDAYGHGAVECAEILDDSEAFAVAIIDEAVLLREAGVKKPLLILQGPQSTDDVRLADQFSLSLVIHDPQQLQMLKTEHTRSVLDVWLKVDTGMGRLGVQVQDVVPILTKLLSLGNLRLTGLLSHFACADQPQHALNAIQLSRLMECHGLVQASSPNNNSLLLSIANSAAILQHSSSHLDWVRPGIMLYGSDPVAFEMGKDSPRVIASSALQPVMTVRAPLIAIKTLTKGATIGYGQGYVCQRDMTVGVVAIGYGDGLPRSITGAQVAGCDPRAYVSINGSRAEVLGRISMDSIVINLSELDHTSTYPTSDSSTAAYPTATYPEAARQTSAFQLGDRVEIWGSSQPVEQLARCAGTLPYELFCSIRGARRWSG